MTVMERLAARAEGLSAVVGRAVSLLTILMVIVTCVVVVARYFFDAGWIWLQEAVTWMHGIVFMLAAAWTLSLDEQVRVDVFYRDLSSRRRAQIDLAGVVLLLLPFCVFLIVVSWDYVAASWHIREASREAGGLPALFLLKTVILVMPVMLLLQGLAMASKAWATLRDSRSERDAPDDR